VLPSYQYGQLTANQCCPKVLDSTATAGDEVGIIIIMKFISDKSPQKQ